MRLSVSGVPEVDRALKRFPDKINKKVARKAVREVAKAVKRDIERLVSSMFIPRTGLLRRSFFVRAVGGSGLLSSVREVNKVRRGTIGASVILDHRAFYGRYLELGTRHITPRKFMRAGLYRNRHRKYKLFLAVMRREFRKQRFDAK